MIASLLRNQHIHLTHVSHAHQRHLLVIGNLRLRYCETAPSGANFALGAAHCRTGLTYIGEKRRGNLRTGGVFFALDWAILLGCFEICGGPHRRAREPELQLLSRTSGAIGVLIHLPCKPLP